MSSASVAHSAHTKEEVIQLIKLGVPAILAQISQMALGVSDTIMAGRVDTEALAAVAVGTNLINPIVIFVVGIFLAMNPIVAHLNGRGDFSKIGSAFQHAVLLAALLALPLMYVLNHVEPVVALLNINTELREIVVDYVAACSLGLVPLFAFFALRCCNEGLFSTRAIMIVSALAVPLNILCNYWFIWGGLGIAPMGVVGVGYSTALIWTFMFLGMLVYSVCTPRYEHLAIFNQWHKFSWQQLREILSLGVPMGLSIGMEIAMFALVGLMIGSYEVAKVASHQIALNIASVAFMIPLGLSFSLSARVGFYSGRGDEAGFRRVVKIGLVMAIVLASFTASIMLMFDHQLVALYSDEVAVLNYAGSLLLLAAIFQLSDGLQVTASGILRGLKDSKIPMVINFIAYWFIGFPLGYFLAEVVGMTAHGYWWGIIAGLTSSAFLLLIRVWMRTKIILNQDELAQA